MSKIGKRVDALLEVALTLKRELSDAGHRITAASPDFVRALTSAPESLGPQPLGQPYEEIAPGLTIGFRKGAKPNLHVRPTIGGELEIALHQRTSSTWVTIEIDWRPDVLIEKRRVTLLLRGSAPSPFTLTSLVRCTAPNDKTTDLEGKPIELGPDQGLHAVEFDCPDDVGSAGLKSCRVILFCPVQPFAMTLTELSLL